MFPKSPLTMKTPSQFSMKLKVFPSFFPIRFITAGMLFILTISPQFISAEKKIPLLDSLQLLTPKDIKVTIEAYGI